MKTIHTFFKNSNTNHLIIKQEFKEIPFDCPIFFYDENRKAIDTPDLTGYVEISEKKFNRYAKKSKQ